MFQRLPWELKTVILCMMAQLRAIRISGPCHNTIVLLYQRSIITALSSKSSGYNCASRIYNISHQPVIPDFKYLYRIARICDIAKSLAVALATQLKKPHYRIHSPDHLPRIPFDPASSRRFVKNVLPYLLALGHFFECYRDGLANYVPHPATVNPIQPPSARVAFYILFGRYNQETRYRICALYHVLKRVFDEHLFCRTQENRSITMAALLNIRGCSYTERIDGYTSDSTDVFTFGGLGAIRDVIAQPTIKLRLGVLEKHFARACSGHIVRAHTLPPSTLSQVDRASAERICRLLPHRTIPILHTETSVLAGGRSSSYQMRQDLEPFYEHLTTYEGDEPNLFRWKHQTTMFQL